jgi:voltage-gated sodium channel
MEKIRQLVRSRFFTTFIIMTIVFAGILVGMETSKDLMARHGDLLHFLDKIVLGIFVVEAALKIISHAPRWWEYFMDPWNVFDFVIVAICFLPFGAQYVAVLRLARVLRVLRLLTVVPRLQILVGALLKSMPSMLYVTILLSLLFYIYAVLGVMLFGENDPKHFSNLGNSLLSLFRVVTLEDWTDIMYINMYGSDQYGYEAIELVGVSSSASPTAAVIFFVSFVLLGTMVMLNLFIGVIMSGMQEAQDEREMLAAEQSGEELPSLDQEISTIQKELEHLSGRLRKLKGRS